MCQISVVYALNGKTGADGVNELLAMMQAGANVNDDGWGIFDNQGQVLKSPETFDGRVKRGRFKRFRSATWAVGHVRLATHGKPEDANTHPLTVGSVTVAHNGVIANETELRTRFGIPSSPAVDSYVIPWLVNHFMGCNDNDIRKAIHATVDELRGSFSVMLYDAKSGRLFHFRRGADFYFRLVEHEGVYYIVGNTKRDNVSSTFRRMLFGFVVKDGESMAYQRPREDILYELSDNGLSHAAVLPSAPVEPVKTVILSAGSYRRWLDEADVLPYMKGENPNDKMSYGSWD